MGDDPVTIEAPAPPQENVAKNASGKLLQVSRDRWVEQRDVAKASDLSGPYMEALCLLQLGMLENDSLRKLRLYARAHAAFQDLAGQFEALGKTIHAMSELLATRTMPEVMDSNDIDDFSLTSGLQVVVKEHVVASLKKELQPAGCAYLEKNGFSALVKRTITVPFTTRQGKLADKVAKAIQKAVGKEQVAIEDQRAVHHSTLSAWVRNQLKEGKELSTETMKLFGVFRQRRAVITEKKAD